MMRVMCVAVALLAVVGCIPEDEPPAFTLAVTPETITDSIPGQMCVFLVTVTEDEADAGDAGPVQITASGSGAGVLVEPAAIEPGEVAEVIVIPAPLDTTASQIIVDGEDEGRTVSATIKGTRAGVEESVTVDVTVTSEEEDLVGALALEKRDLFIPWLAEQRPELGITEDTQWTGTIVTPHILVVTHYLYLSDEWEMHVFWHVMIEPYNWAGIELRRRFQETVPSLAFKIPSITADPIEVEEIEPEGTLWR